MMQEKKPTLFGYGLTTKAIAKKLGNGCIFFDDNIKESFTDEFDNTIHPSSKFDPQKSNLEILTPSIKPNHPLLQKAKQPISEYDYFLGNHIRTKPFNIWISGTNGKTTTTQMLTHLLQKRGAISGGNIGTPLADMSMEAKIWILESSSFTLHHTKSAAPNIYILLPITPDHLDWHGSKEAYEEAKLSPLRNMREGEMALIPKGLKLPKSNAFIIEYDSNEFLAKYFDIDITKIDFKGAFLQDALLAMAVTKVLYGELDYKLMNAFVKEAHRQQEITDSKGRLWVNDSKATNLDATIQAVRTYGDKELHLILGGDDKGIALDELFDVLKEHKITIYAIGSNEAKLMNLAKKYNIPASSLATLNKAIKEIDKHLTKDSIALLSPAAASLDQFSSYKERGELFINRVKEF
ncbi:MAG: UDP-N-acetylmuramoyl-L-alanine--D-glutamate ligase [Campylobacterales bacterium]|nr:UDP-N-acetylmuramoyl-L-alanine--D-glutamate ligase [Campylobacterales bacterium]